MRLQDRDQVRSHDPPTAAMQPIAPLTSGRATTSVPGWIGLRYARGATVSRPEEEIERARFPASLRSRLRVHGVEKRREDVDG